ncbi:hypothetical protein [Candidatus Lokiarchaeum ossiferum]|uniref:hypothetical protein n=1 Tax=Candidatus Lokiarchaeum ossiferum TaxID=2951803 RepID=UPI00352C0268
MSDYSYFHEVSTLIDETSHLREKVILAINKRKINCSQVQEDRQKILEIVNLNHAITQSASILLFKPRFSPAIKLLSHNLRIHAINLFERIRLHFEENPFYQIPEYVYDLFLTNEKENKYKHSILCLVENQVHKTDEIYGDYIGIIRLSDSKIMVSLYSTRRNELRELICKDKIFIEMKNVLIFLNEFVIGRINEEIANRIEYLLAILMKGKENYELLSKKFPKIPNSKDTSQILKLGRRRLIVNEFEGLFYLGYAMEHWVKYSIMSKYSNNVSHQKLYNLIEFLKANNWYENKYIEILHEIRIVYNNLRHEPEYPINSGKVWELYEKFQKIIEIIC